MGMILWVAAALLGGVLEQTGMWRKGMEVALIAAAAIVVFQYVLLDDPAAFDASIIVAALGLLVLALRPAFRD